MKKLIIVLVLATVIATGTAFADHPKGFGIGVVGFYPGGGGLSLKIPNVPIFWAINMGFGSNKNNWWGEESWFSLNLTGDYYLIDAHLGGPVHWFLGLGGYLGLYSHSGKNNNDSWTWTDMIIGARIPVGISIQPVKLLEIFLDVAPCFGVGFYGDNKYNYGSSSVGNYWAFPIELGIRLWF